MIGHLRNVTAGLSAGHYETHARAELNQPHNTSGFKILSVAKKKCVACDGSIPPFDTSEIHKYLKKVDDWDVKSNEDKNYYLIKNFKFKNLFKFH